LYFLEIKKNDPEFLDEKQSDYGIRTSLENFGAVDKIKIIPIYAIGIAVKNKFQTIQEASKT